MAVAMSAVLQRKYAPAAPSSGLAIVASGIDASPAFPPSTWNAHPAAWTLMTRLAMLNSVRYGGFFVVIRNVHWLHALIAPTIIVCAGPSRMRERKSTAYETDIDDTLRASGRVTLKADVADDSTRSVTNHTGCSNRSSGKNTAKSAAPPAITAPT